MLKLLRNTFATKDHQGNIIRWQYLEDLHQNQDREGLRLANKLSGAHVNWQAQEMKVKLAAQTQSSSVADSLEFCRDGLQLAAFQNCHSTVQFLQTVDQVFDILNSRNKFARGLKGAMKPDQSDGDCSALPVLESAFSYLKALTDVAGKLLYKTQKKTATVGFLATIRAVQGIY
ncbi:hypothetical protein BaRGS_00032049 [Batillaria attramentaria]|uniref:Transposable element P transposase-like GTP-binding insertion domain-containing protein n=1 Tax=Batillaria attramentaria TaxID=370345 RepID=A0ABD0JP76_9CAEN